MGREKARKEGPGEPKVPNNFGLVPSRQNPARGAKPDGGMLEATAGGPLKTKHQEPSPRKKPRCEETFLRRLNRERATKQRRKEANDGAIGLKTKGDRDDRTEGGRPKTSALKPATEAPPVTQEIKEFDKPDGDKEGLEDNNVDYAGDHNDENGLDNSVAADEDKDDRLAWRHWKRRTFALELRWQQIEVGQQPLPDLDSLARGRRLTRQRMRSPTSVKRLEEPRAKPSTMWTTTRKARRKTMATPVMENSPPSQRENGWSWPPSRATWLSAVPRRPSLHMPPRMLKRPPTGPTLALTTKGTLRLDQDDPEAVLVWQF